LKQWATLGPFGTVKAVRADGLYGRAEFLTKVKEILAQSQAISQLSRDPKGRYRGRSWNLDNYFKAYPGVSQTVSVRGFETKEVVVSSARLDVQAPKCKRVVVALHEVNETETRYLGASHLANY